MDERIIEFARLLRDNGVRVSLAESLDSFEALRLVGLGERERLRSALRATMVKRPIDVPTFDELFTLYFGGLGEILKAAEERARSAGGLTEPEDLEALLEDLRGLLEAEDASLSELVREWLEGDPARLERRIRDALRQLASREGSRLSGEGASVHRLAQQLGLPGALREIEGLRERAGRSDLPEDRREQLERYLEARLKELSSLVREAVRQEMAKQNVEHRSRRSRSLGEKSFYYLTDEEMQETREAIDRLARRLRNVMAVRRKRDRRGKLHVRNTLRHNMQYGSIPFRLHFDHRRKEKPQVVVLCDVSDSVRNASRFMLQFVYSLQDLYSRVRSFVFVAEPGEITQLFKENDVQEAIHQALQGDVINVWSHSDFGRTFRLFHRDHLDVLNRRTTVIVLGDARNNYNLPNEWALKEIRGRSKQLLWLNPESRMTWGFGDSEMDRYLPYCDLAEECRNLNQLYRVIDRLVATA